MTDERSTSSGGAAEAPDEVTGVTQAVTPDEAGSEDVTQVAVAPAETPAETAPARRPSRLRRILIGLLIVLSCLAVVVSGLTIWAHYTVMNTDGYMNLVGPVGKDPQAIANLSDYIAGQVVTATDVEQRVTEALPPRAQFLAGPITTAVDDFVTKGATKVLSTPQFYQLWLKVNEVAHEKIVALLRGDTTKVYTQGSDIKLNLVPIISQVLVWVDEKLPGGLGNRFNPPVVAPDADPVASIQEVANWSGRPLPSDFGQVTLLTSDALGPAQTAVKWFDRLVWIIPLVTIVLIALTIWLSRRRRRTAIALGIGAAIAIVLTRVVVKRASLVITDKLEEGGGFHLAKDVVNASLGPLTTITIWIVVLGVLAAIVVWFLGRRDLQTAAVVLGKRAVRQGGDVGIPDAPVTSWVGRHVLGVRWGVLVVGLLVLALFAWSWVWIVLIVVIVLLFEAVLSLLAGQWPFADKESDEGASG